MTEKWTTAAVCIVVAAVMGCQQPRVVLTGLPTHELDLSTPSPARPLHVEEVFAQPRQIHRADPEWTAAGHRPWRYVVIHHSATGTGSARMFDKMHRRRGWDELGYHFVICNGSGGPDGRVETGSRWRRQKWGAHCGGTPNNEYNNYGIGICLVGNFQNGMPSRAQLASLRRLVLHLMGVYDIPPENVIGHRDAPGARTCCPGRTFHAHLNGRFRPMLAERLARAN